MQTGSQQMKQQHLNIWRKKYPSLPIFPKLFSVSSTTSTKSVRTLLSAIETECERIFSLHTTHIPTSYVRFLHTAQSQPIEDQALLVDAETLHQHCCPHMGSQAYKCMLQYLHAIGHIVFIEKKGLIFVNPILAPKIAAKFISPEDIRMALLKREEEKVQLLSMEDIGYLIDIQSTDNKRFGSITLLINNNILQVDGRD